MPNHEKAVTKQKKWCQLFLKNAAHMFFHICSGCFNGLLKTMHAHVSTYAAACLCLFPHVLLLKEKRSTSFHVFDGGHSSAAFLSEDEFRNSFNVFPAFYWFYSNQHCPFTCTSQCFVVGVHVRSKSGVPMQRVRGEHSVCFGE